ncbi:MAG: dihydropteroate synthase, partial [Actinomycetota bacterium]|nr:dihydropteroate synthase [Actinomycetota bacterium]
MVDLPDRSVMGVVNVTPDSFSDGGRFLDPRRAVAHGRELVAAGADLLDVGGESTRPGADPVAVDEELRRVLPVVEALAADAAVPVSIDTSKAAVAAAALRAGAAIVNDVTAGLGDPDLLAVVAGAGAALIAMHMQGEPRTMQQAPHYDDVTREVAAFLTARLDAARAAGIRADALLADPGIGFGKTIDHNLELLARLADLRAAVGVPIVAGASRKTFLGKLTGDALPSDRDDATLAATVWSFTQGVR